MSEQPLSLSLDVSAVPLKLGGAGYYTVALVNELATRADVDLHLVARRDDVARWSPIGNVAVTGAVPSSRPARLVFEQLRFPPLLRSLGVAVHHAPHYTMPERASIPCVVTIHDCTFFDHPEWHVRSKAAFFRRAIRRAALHASAVVCVSEVTAERLHANCNVRAPVVVAPHGVDHVRFSELEPVAGADAAAVEVSGDPYRSTIGGIRRDTGAAQGPGAAYHRVRPSGRDSPRSHARVGRPAGLGIGGDVASARFGPT